MSEPKFRLVSKDNNAEDVEEIAPGVNYILLVTTDRAKNGGDFFLGAVRWFNEDEDPDHLRAISVSPVATCLQRAEERNCIFAAPTILDSQQSATATVTYSVLLIPLLPQILEVSKHYILDVVWSYTSAPFKADEIASAPAGQDTVHYWSPTDDRESDGRVLFQAVPGPNDFTNLLHKSSGTPSATASPTDPANTSALGVLPKQTGGGAGAMSDAPPSKETGAPNDASNNALGGASGAGLSTGAKAGIAVGAVLAVLATVALIFLCLRRRKSKRKTPGGYFGDAPSSSNDLREKEAAVGIAANPVSASLTSDGHHAHNGAAAILGRGHSERVVDGASLERGDVGGHATPVAGVGAAGVARKPIGSWGVSNDEPIGREGAMSSQSQVLTDEERATWEEEERRLDEDIAEAERRRLAQ